MESTNDFIDTPGPHILQEERTEMKEVLPNQDSLALLQEYSPVSTHIENLRANAHTLTLKPTKSIQALAMK